MERMFTKDCGAHFKKGEVRDYPKGTWDQIKDSIGARSLDEFSEVVTRGTPAKAMLETKKAKAPLAQSGAT